MNKFIFTSESVTEGHPDGNYSSDEAKEIARLKKKELKDIQDTLDVLKKAIGILGK